MKLLSGRFSNIIIITLCVVSRLPQLLSNNLVLDGDECVLALMAKHIYSLKEFPLFFYGQNYGLSLIECVAIIPFYVVAGMTTISVKSAMLLLWTVGIVFMYKTYLQVNTKDPIIPFFLFLLFICSPAWAVWSMKARGGYVTSFMLTSILLYFLFHQKIKATLLVYAVIGLLVVLIYESQPFWLPGLTPFLLYRLFKEKSIQKLTAFGVASASGFVFFYLYKKGITDHYIPPFFSYGVHSFSLISRIPYFLFSSLHGNYFYNRVQKPGVFTALSAYIFCGIIFFLCLVSLYNLLKRRKGFILFHLSVLSLLLTLLYTVFIDEVHPRYLLPITGYTLLSLLFLFQKFSIRKQIFITCASLSLLPGIISLILFKDFKFSTMQKNNLGKLITYLEINHVHYVYCYDYMLAYQVIFYSHEQMISREQGLSGRYPPYSKQVDSVLNNGGKTALLYNELQLRDMKFKDVNGSGGYCIVFDPPKNELEKIFRFMN